MGCLIELLKCIICCEKEHSGDSNQAAHENRSYTQIPTSSTLSRDASQFEEEEDANNWNPVLFNAPAVQGSSYLNNCLSVKPPDVIPEPILLPSVPIPSIDPLLSGGIINKSLTQIDQMLPSSSGITPPLSVSLPVKPPDVTPEPILFSSVPIPSIDPLLPGGIINKSLTQIDQMLPYSSGISTPPLSVSLPVKPPDVTPEPILFPSVPIPSIDPPLLGGIINKSLTQIDQMLPYSSGISTPPLSVSLPVKPPDVTPEPILFPSVPIPSIDPPLLGGIINKSLTPIDPMLPSSSGIPSSPSPSHLSNPPKETEYVLVKKVTTTYEVPEDFRTLIKRDIIPGVLKKPLSPLTYRDYFAALLYAEEYYTEKSSEYRLSDVSLKLHKMEGKCFVAFEIVPERRRFFFASDHVLVKPASKNAKPFKGRVYRVVKGKIGNLVFAEFGVDFCSTYSSELKYDVRFSLCSVKRCQQAVETAMDPLFLQAFLFPNQASRVRDLNPSYLIPCYQNVDYVQALAIYRISMIKNPPPYLIEGPFCVTCDNKLSRTGLVIQQAVLRICELSPGCRILINAPTNRTCDVLMRTLMEKIPESAMFRAKASLRVTEGDYGVPCDILPLCTLQEGCFTYPSLQELKSFKVILSTYVNSVRLRMEGIHSGHFSHIFLVDASTAIEPEIMISLVNLAGPETVVVVSGCSTKSPTRIRSSMARWNGLRLSYFERLLGREPYCSRDPTFITCIDECI